MNARTVRYYLHNLDGLQQEISDLEADIGQYKAMSTEHFRVLLDPDPYQHTHMPIPAWPEKDDPGLSGTVSKSSKSRFCDYSHVENLVVRRVSFIEYLEKELFKKKNLLAAINCILYYLTPQDKKMIELRYKKHWAWAKIAIETNYAEYYLKHRDVRIIKDILKNYQMRIKSGAND